METISKSVGEGGVNFEGDVRTIQTLLNKHSPVLGLGLLEVNGNADSQTIAAIRLFQARIVQLSKADGRVDPGGRTLLALNGTVGVTVASGNLSGAAWWHANQALFPNSDQVSDLESPFAAKVNLFISALSAAGASVDVGATRRNKARAYLMHYSWKIARDRIKAGDVPSEPGCDISWNHGDDLTSRRAAQEMVDLFGVVFQPSLTSRHILGLAIDMTIDWNGSITVRDAAGNDVRLSSPSNGANVNLHGVGASFGVVKLVSDPPHWSDNGH